jgi:hypothetical protein
VIGGRVSLVLCTTLLVSGVSLGGWRAPLPSLAHPTRDAPAVVISRVPQADVVDVRVFYEPLAPFGTWMVLPEYGWVWSPHGVPPKWRPYTVGRWVYTEYGWTWVSDWAWGWAPFHYGRWVWVTSYGWVWIPGTVWGPAWVVWRYAPGWVGWAPLPPQVVVSSHMALGDSDMAVSLEPSWFCFVKERHFLAPTLMSYLVPQARNRSLIQRTQNVTHNTVPLEHMGNQSIPVERIERALGRPVPRMRIVDAPSPDVKSRATVGERAREVVLFRPDVSAVAAPPGPGGLPPKGTSPSQMTPGTTRPQLPQDTPRRLDTPRSREHGALEAPPTRERQGAARQQPPRHPPPVPPQVSPAPRAAPPQALEAGKEPRKQSRHHPPVRP